MAPFMVLISYFLFTPTSHPHRFLRPCALCRVLQKDFQLPRVENPAQGFIDDVITVLIMWSPELNPTHTWTLQHSRSSCWMLWYNFPPRFIRAKALLLWNPQLFRIASENVRQHGLLHRTIFVCTVRPGTVCALVKIPRLKIVKKGYNLTELSLETIYSNEIVTINCIVINSQF